ncbi:MAG TPA: histidine triad nucleotide-binding protein [Candidatus Acidoferrales bacterium]|nr:histidine triad nucleotide-binding protein [Candidatus Acidoferrales bacterium]
MECIFCDIAAGRKGARIVYQDDRVVGFHDIRPRAPTHLLLIPRKHIATLLELESGDEELIGHIFTVASSLAREQRIAEKGFRVVVNCGADAGQSVYHIHFHLMGGRAFGWPPG